MSFSYFSLLKNLDNNSVLVNNKLVLLKKLRRVNKKIFLKNVYLRNNFIKKQNNFKFKFLNSRYISTTLKFKLYRKDFSSLKKSFLFFYKSNKFKEFNFINNFPIKKKFYFKYFLNIGNKNVSYSNHLKLNSFFSFKKLISMNLPIVYKISNKFSKYKNSVFFENFNYKYIYNHLLNKQYKFEKVFKDTMKSVQASFYLSKDLNNSYILINNKQVFSNNNLILDSYKKLNTFTNFINFNELVTNTKLWFFLKKYKMVLKKNLRNIGNHFLLFNKNKIKFKRSNFSYFFNLSSFSEYYSLENHNFPASKGNLFYFYYLNSQKIMLNNFFRFFKNYEFFGINSRILNNMLLLSSLNYFDILKYKKIKNLININSDSIYNTENLTPSRILYNFYNKQSFMLKDLNLINPKINSYIEFYNINSIVFNKNYLNIIKKIISSGFFISFINLDSNKFLNFSIFLFDFYKKLYNIKLKNYFLAISVYDF